MSNQIMFSDSQGNEWYPTLTVPVLLKVSKEQDITIAKITNMEINISCIIDVIYYAVEKQAMAKGISKAQFVENLSLEDIGKAIECLTKAIEKAFPSANISGILGVENTSIPSTPNASSTNEKDSPSPFVDGEKKT